MRILGYIRVSTDMQTNGIDVQKRAIEDYAAKICIPIHNLYIDEAISGKSEKRNGLFNLMNDIKRGDIVVVQKRDRLSRDSFFIQAIEKEFKKKKSKLISTSGEGTESDDYNSIFMRRLIDAFSEMERSIISSRVKLGMQNKIRNNEFVGTVPYGKQLSSDGIHLEDNDKELEILDYMIAMRERGLSVAKIIKQLTSKSMLTRHNKTWCRTTIDHLLNKHIGKPRRAYNRITI